MAKKAEDWFTEELKKIRNKKGKSYVSNEKVKPIERVEKEEEGYMYIVYEGEFETDKPRNNMAEPSIIAITNNFSKARNKFLEVLNKYKELRYVEIYYDENDISRSNAPYDYYYFDFINGYSLGKVGILKERILED